VKPVIPVIAGPTAVGKTAVSVALAKLLDGEVVSADSRQIYAPFRIGTARPTPEEMQGVPHHLLGQLELHEAYSAGRFADQATSLIPGIQDRGKHVVVVGGSTLYVHALIEGLSDIPKVDPSIRQSLNSELEQRGPAALHTELAEADPVFAKSLDATKSQRIIRGLEVFRGTGKPLSDFHRPPPLPDQKYRLFVLHVERQSLYKRIDSRVDQMVEEGLIEEVRAAWEANPVHTLNAWRTIGYQELLPWFDGECTLDEAIRLIKRNSRRYAKRQLTWYKRYPDALWLDSSEQSTDDLAKTIAEVIRPLAN
jgi:tRNA dimethylallyltransferase